MPLILITGLPSSGKTCTAEKIGTYFKGCLDRDGHNRKVKIISDTDHLDWEGRNQVYSGITKEKELRGWLRAEAQRYINLNQIVILDSANYIKGFRYELFCMSKEANTQYCVVECLIDKDTCWQWNLEKESKLEADKSAQDTPELCYSRETFDALTIRYEQCDGSNRWDSPLFRITKGTDDLDLKQIYQVIVNDPPLEPNKCTSISTTTDTLFRPKSIN